MGEVVAGRRSGVQVDHAGVADGLGPLLVRRVVGEAGVVGLRDDLVDALLRLPEDRPAVMHVVEHGFRRRTAGDELLQCFLGLAVVLDLHHRDGSRLRAAGVDRRDGGAVAQPRVDVVVEGEPVAAEALDQLVAELLADVVDAVDADLVLERRELVQGLERVDLLATAGVEVDARVGDRGRRQRFGRLGALLEEGHRGPGTATDDQQADDAATHEPRRTTAPAAGGRLALLHGRRRPVRACGVEVLGRAGRRLLIGHGGAPRDVGARRRVPREPIPSRAPTRPLPRVRSTCRHARGGTGRPVRRRTPGTGRTARPSATPGRASCR